MSSSSRSNRCLLTGQCHQLDPKARTSNSVEGSAILGAGTDEAVVAPGEEELCDGLLVEGRVVVSARWFSRVHAVEHGCNHTQSLRLRSHRLRRLIYLPVSCGVPVGVHQFSRSVARHFAGGIGPFFVSRCAFGYFGNPGPSWNNCQT